MLPRTRGTCSFTHRAVTLVQLGKAAALHAFEPADDDDDEEEEEEEEEEDDDGGDDAEDADAGGEVAKLAGELNAKLTT